MKGRNVRDTGAGVEESPRSRSPFAMNDLIQRRLKDENGNKVRYCGLGLVLAMLASAQAQPVIVTQPTDQTVVQGETATFCVVATGTEPLAYQWQRYVTPSVITNIPWETASCMVLTNVQPGTRQYLRGGDRRERAVRDQ